MRNSYTSRNRPFYTFPQYAALTFILTPLLAYFLATTGSIPFEPIQAALMALAFSVVYVAYVGYYWKRNNERAEESVE